MPWFEVSSPSKGCGTQQIPEHANFATSRPLGPTAACSARRHFSVLAHFTDDLSCICKNKTDWRALLIRFKYLGDSSFTVNLLDRLPCKIPHWQCGRPAWKLRMREEIEGERFLSMIWNWNVDSYGKHLSLSQRGQGICHMFKIFHSNNSLGSFLEQVNALLHKEKTWYVKILLGVFPYPWNFSSQCHWTACVVHATMTGFLPVKYSPTPTACSAGGPRSPDVVPLIVSELILGVEGYSFGRE